MSMLRPHVPGSRRSVLAGFLAGFVAAALLAGGVAMAAIPSTGTGVFYACRSTVIGPAYGTVRVIDYQAGKRCRSTEKLIHWGATGPRGPQGVAGASGAKGDPGVAGPPGVAGAPGNPRTYEYTITYTSDGVTTFPQGHSAAVIPAGAILVLEPTPSSITANTVNCTANGGLTVSVGVGNGAFADGSTQAFAFYQSIGATAWNAYYTTPQMVVSTSAPFTWQAHCRTSGADAVVPSFTARFVLQQATRTAIS